VGQVLLGIFKNKQLSIVFSGLIPLLRNPNKSFIAIYLFQCFNLFFLLVGCFENNIDYYQEDLSNTNTITKEGCMKDCMDHQGCHFWTLDQHNTKRCYLKKEGAINNRRVKNNIISGTKFCPGNFLLVVKLLQV